MQSTLLIYDYYSPIGSGYFRENYGPVNINAIADRQRRIFSSRRSLCANLHTPDSDKVAHYRITHGAFVLITFRERFFTAVITSLRRDFLRFSSSRECVVYRIVSRFEMFVLRAE